MIDKVILLSAGQGSRLLPLTADRPKCLIDLSGRSLLAWQVEMPVGQGVSEIVVITGFMTELVERELERLARPGLVLKPLFNPFYKVADNLGSCWMALAEMDRDFAILNGDTLVSGEIVRRLISACEWPITVSVDVKPHYDSDDMKVSLSGSRLLAIDKTLVAGQANAESIGFLAFRGFETEGGTIKIATFTPTIAFRIRHTCWQLFFNWLRSRSVRKCRPRSDCRLRSWR